MKQLRSSLLVFRFAILGQKNIQNWKATPFMGTGSRLRHLIRVFTNRSLLLHRLSCMSFVACCMLACMGCRSAWTTPLYEGPRKPKKEIAILGKIDVVCPGIREIDGKLVTPEASVWFMAHLYGFELLPGTHTFKTVPQFISRPRHLYLNMGTREWFTEEWDDEYFDLSGQFNAEGGHIYYVLGGLNDATLKHSGEGHKDEPVCTLKAHRWKVSHPHSCPDTYSVFEAMKLFELPLPQKGTIVDYVIVTE